MGTIIVLRKPKFQECVGPAQMGTQQQDMIPPKEFAANTTWTMDKDHSRKKLATIPELRQCNKQQATREQQPSAHQKTGQFRGKANPSQRVTE